MIRLWLGRSRPGDTVYDPTSGSGGMLVHTADYLREHGQPNSARYFAQEMNWGNAAIGKINSVLHGLEADISSLPASENLHNSGLMHCNKPMGTGLLTRSPRWRGRAARAARLDRASSRSSC